MFFWKQDVMFSFFGADPYFTNMFQTGWPNHLVAKAIHTENLGFDTSQGPKVFCPTQKMTWTCIDHMTETSLFGWFEHVKTKYIKIWCWRTISKIGHAKIWFHRDSEADVMLFLANYIDSTFLCPMDFGTVSRALVDVKPTSIYTSTWLCTGVFRDALCFQRDKWGRCLGDGFKDAWCSHLV